MITHEEKLLDDRYRDWLIDEYNRLKREISPYLGGLEYMVEEQIKELDDIEKQLEERNITFKNSKKRDDFPPAKRIKRSFSFSPPVWYDETKLSKSPVYKNAQLEKVVGTADLGLYYLVDSIKKEKEVCIISKKEFKTKNYPRNYGEFTFEWEQDIYDIEEVLSNFGWEQLNEDDFKGELFVHTNLTKKLKRCLDNESTKIILIPFTLWGYKFEKDGRNKYIFEAFKEGESIEEPFTRFGHRVMIIINKYLQTVEFYDSNGSEPHQKMFGNYDYEKASAFLKETFPEYFKDYHMLSYVDTCPRQAFQHFEKVRKKKELGELGGFCLFWSVFNAHMRIKYPEVPAIKLQEDILKKMREKRPYGYLAKFIKNYTIFLQKLL